MNAATQNEMERLVRVNREQQALLDQIYQYVDEKGLAKWGQSRVKALIEAHKRAEVERDELRKLAYIGEHLHEDCSWKFRFSELKAERDALAAHLERLRTAWRQYEDSEYCSEDEIKAEEQLYALMGEDPATSLARLKAQWQAEALEELLQNTSQFREANPVRGLAGSMADELRQQAEGGES